MKEAGEKSRARERRRDNKRKGDAAGERRIDEDGESGKTNVTSREREGGERGRRKKKKGTWLRDEERDRWIKERDG